MSNIEQNMMRGSDLPIEMKMSDEPYKMNWHILETNIRYVDTRDGSQIVVANGTSKKAEFRLYTEHMMDPLSLALSFRATINQGATPDVGMVDFAASMFDTVRLEFVGTFSGVIEEILNYGHYNFMLKQFFTTEYLQTVSAFIEGYSGLTALAENSYLSGENMWNDREFCFPLELGFFTTSKKLIPLFVLPEMKLTIQFNQNVNHYLTKLTDSQITLAQIAAKTITIDNLRLQYREITVSEVYREAVEKKIKDKYLTKSPMKIDYLTWTSSVEGLTGGTAQTIRMAYGNGSVKKIMFALCRSEPLGSADNDGITLPVIGYYPQGKLIQYQALLNGQAYPNLQTVVAVPTTFQTYKNAISDFQTSYSNGVFERDRCHMLYKGSNKNINALFSPRNVNTVTNLGTFLLQYAGENIYTIGFDYNEDFLTPLFTQSAMLNIEVRLTFSGDPTAESYDRVDNFIGFYQYAKTIKIGPNRQVEVLFNQTRDTRSGGAEKQSAKV